MFGSEWGSVVLGDACGDVSGVAVEVVVLVVADRWHGSSFASVFLDLKVGLCGAMLAGRW